MLWVNSTIGLHSTHFYPAKKKVTFDLSIALIVRMDQCDVNKALVIYRSMKTKNLLNLECVVSAYLKDPFTRSERKNENFL